jgi:hypothetical protein
LYLYFFPFIEFIVTYCWTLFLACIAWESFISVLWSSFVSHYLLIIIVWALLLLCFFFKAFVDYWLWRKWLSLIFHISNWISN